MIERVKDIASPAAIETSFGALADGGLVVSGSSQAALLFGSSSPTVEEDDALTLVRLLLDRYDASAEDGLSDLVEDIPPGNVPGWEHGYELAESVLDSVGEELISDAVDVEQFLLERAVALTEVTLSDRFIRAVSLTSRHHSPTIALNVRSRYFASPAARRFSLAHELCHLLFDRTRGVQLAVASGPWAPTVIEQRANAFAAMLLMPPELVAATVEDLGGSLETLDGAAEVASRLGVGVSALIEHAHNVGLVDEIRRDELRVALAESLEARHPRRT